MTKLRHCVVVLLFFLAFSLAPQRQALAVQSSSSIVLVATVEWEPSAADLVLIDESNGRSVLGWTIGGAILGAGIGWFGSALANASSESSDDGAGLRAAVIGAALGATAGLILSVPDSREPGELRLAPFVRAYFPARGGVGLVLDL